MWSSSFNLHPSVIEKKKPEQRRRFSLKKYRFFYCNYVVLRFKRRIYKIFKNPKIALIARIFLQLKHTSFAKNDKKRKKKK